MADRGPETFSTLSAERAAGSTTSTAPLATSAVPPEWETLWHSALDEELPTRVLARMREVSRRLAAEVPLIERSDVFRPLVGAADLRSEPVHRWYTYKEAFSPSLPAEVLKLLPDLGDDLIVGDVFGGVATTALALRGHRRVRQITSVEYSPFARFVGATKLAWDRLDADRLAEHVPRLLDYKLRYEIPPPDLAAFRNVRIVAPSTRASLLSAREQIDALPGLQPHERDFFRLGLAAIIEDASGAMKDGRALRIRGSRSRIPSSLGGAALASSGGTGGRVKRMLAAQWSAMVNDVRGIGHAEPRETARATHVSGDARDLAAARQPDGEEAFPAEGTDLFLFSPPYLNCIDYTEVYKLELWLLGHVTDQAGFRNIRRGTLRSHPSIRFDEVEAFRDLQSPVVDLIGDLSGWVSKYGSRREVGLVVRQYFEDMFRVYQEQSAALRPGGMSVCVVANSTFSRRRGPADARVEEWRLPVLTDVLLAHLAKEAGFGTVEIWGARELRPRNVRAGSARESLVVATKN